MTCILYHRSGRIASKRKTPDGGQMFFSKMNFENLCADPVFDYIIMQSGAHVKKKAPVGADAFPHMYNLIDE